MVFAGSLDPKEIDLPVKFVLRIIKNLRKLDGRGSDSLAFIVDSNVNLKYDLMAGQELHESVIQLNLVVGA